jgi:bifunctional non-homologous end joining protein LigD
LVFPIMVARRRESTFTIAGVAITHPERVIAPAPELTKLDIVRYYDAVAEVMLPHLRDRPLTLVQCAPDVAHCRYLRHSGASRPPSQVRIVNIREQTKIGDYMVVDNATGLIALAQRNILEFHTWNSTTGRLETPNRIVLDLDPGPAVPWRVVVDAARQVRALLQDLGLRSWPKTTGGAGLHVVIPIVPRRNWSMCLKFAKSVAASLVEHDPARYTMTFAKRGRDDKILVDYLRNNRTNTAVCAYSARSRTSVPVSVPIAWDELSPRRRPERWTVRTVPKRVRDSPDPWASYFETRQHLPL